MYSSLDPWTHPRVTMDFLDPCMLLVLPIPNIILPSQGTLSPFSTSTFFKSKNSTEFSVGSTSSVNLSNLRFQLNSLYVYEPILYGSRGDILDELPHLIVLLQMM